MEDISVNKLYVQINNDKELIAQSELENLCKKQINIYDCCRSEIETLTESRAFNEHGVLQVWRFFKVDEM